MHTCRYQRGTRARWPIKKLLNGRPLDLLNQVSGMSVECCVEQRLDSTAKSGVPSVCGHLTDVRLCAAQEAKQWFLAAGYAVCTIDVRGTGASYGRVSAAASCTQQILQRDSSTAVRYAGSVCPLGRCEDHATIYCLHTFGDLIDPRILIKGGFFFFLW